MFSATHFLRLYSRQKAVMSCIFAMQAEEVCVYTSVKFDLCSVFALKCTNEWPIIDGGRILVAYSSRV